MEWPSGRAVLANHGLAFTELQRAEGFLSLSDPVDLTNELLNVVHRNWYPYEFPEYLLLEAESGILIREVQEDTFPWWQSCGQMENGWFELSWQSQNRSRCSRCWFRSWGGLLNRRIYHVSFSRALSLNEAQAEAIGRMYRSCMANGGILLVQPEHILSFKLMGLECLITGHERKRRNFSMKFELVYTMGIQRPIEFSPERWTLIQTVLDLVARFAIEVKRLSIEVNDQ
ncbi:hypothetical protein K469DRAFT_725755 [Zopfia rhizophila CBS 207.26]|uniref:ubiquitinyl hydrolase 1 n=1 Tax=Zopfia rhizophila CBS 207.26 TaxID=1314779 RepID=A0A6A6EWU0_9PEZI|nr:hypothetical protein K469DRAFT_725755 [Zopfia rhizophila CBS 207.26]